MIAILIWFLFVADVAIGWKIAAFILYGIEVAVKTARLMK